MTWGISFDEISFSLDCCVTGLWHTINTNCAFKEPSKIAAGGTFIFYFYLSKKIRLDVSEKIRLLISLLPKNQAIGDKWLVTEIINSNLLNQTP